MRSYPSVIETYRSNGRAHWQIDFISIRAKAIGDPSTTSWFHFCSADDDMTAEIVRPDTGETISRTFLGGGHLVSIDDVVRSEGTAIRSHGVVLSGISDDVRDMVLGYDIRDALFEHYIGEVNEDTGLVLHKPSLEFVGLVSVPEPVDGPLDVGSAEPAVSTISLTVNSIGATLLSRNYDMRSIEASRSRSDDLFFEYADVAHRVSVWWGDDKRSQRDKKGGKDKKDDDDYTVRPHDR